MASGLGRNASVQLPQTLDTSKLVGIVGTAGEQTGAVYKFTLGRPDLKVVEMGAPINARMGLNTWAAFTGTNEKAAIAGDVAMLESEVVPVLKALRKNGLDVVAIHHHMTNDRPMMIFLTTGGPGRPKTGDGFQGGRQRAFKNGGKRVAISRRRGARRRDRPYDA